MKSDTSVNFCWCHNSAPIHNLVCHLSYKFYLTRNRRVERSVANGNTGLIATGKWSANRLGLDRNQAFVFVVDFYQPSFKLALSRLHSR